jgi:hypothetical protein
LDFAFQLLHGSTKTRVQARPASQAKTSVEENLGLGLLALGVGTPLAPHRTPFEKHDGTDTRTIVGTEALHVKNQKVPLS